MSKKVNNIGSINGTPINKLSTTKILNLSPDLIKSMNTDELRAITNTLNKSANNRIKKIYNRGLYKDSYLIENLENGNNKKPIPGVKVARVYNPQTGRLTYNKIAQFTNEINSPKNEINALRANLSNVKNYLQSKTSTYRGLKSYENKMKRRIGKKFFETKETRNAFWGAYNKFSELYPNGKDTQLTSDQVIKWFSSMGKSNKVPATEEALLALAVAEEERTDLLPNEKFTSAGNSKKFFLSDIDDLIIE